MGEGGYSMAYNITGAHPKLLDPKHRVKTGYFRDAFARSANKRRNQARTSKVPFFNGKSDGTKPYNEQKRFSWIPYFHRTNDDEESPRDGLKKHRDQDSDLHIYRMRIPIAWSRIPIGGEKETLFLATDENSQPQNPGPGDQTLHWIHMQHYKGIKFDTFKSTALDGINIPVNAKNMTKNWISDIYSLEAQRIFGGKALDSCFQKQRLSSISGQFLVCVFFAVPYLLLSENCQSVVDKKANTDLHPVRALVQSAYRTDSSFTRGKSQAAWKVLGLEENALVYVLQLWGLIIGDYYLVTCAPAQVHTHRQSSIIPLPLNEFPPALRLIREDGSIFYINFMECPTWFDFLIRIHHIYSCWLKRHIDAEKCRFYDAETNEVLVAGSWPAVLYKARAYGVCTTVMVVLNTKKILHHEQNRENEAYFIAPDTDTRTWVRMSKRFIDVETLDAFNLPWEEDTNNSTIIIIKTYLDVDFTEVLFEHTRRSRRMREEDEVRELSDNEAKDHKSVSNDKNRDHTRLAWHWPGCSEKDPADELRRAEGEMFWAPNSSFLDDLVGEDEGYGSPQSTHDPSDASIKSSRLSTDSRAQTAVLSYLLWPLASETSALSHNQGQKTVTRIPELRIAHSWKRGSGLVPLKFLCTELQKEEAFAKLARAKKTDLIKLQVSFLGAMPTALYYPEIELCKSLCDLVDHFLPDYTECLLKDKIYGGLHTILKECLKTSRATKDTRLPQLKEFANRSSRLFELSGEILTGIQTDTSRLPLLTAHVDCFKELCRAISQLCCFIQQALSAEIQDIGTQPEVSQPDSDTLDKVVDLDSTNDNIPIVEYSNADIPEASITTRYTIEDREIPWRISPQSTGTAGTLGDRIPTPPHRVPSPATSILSNRTIGDRNLPQRRRTDSRERAWDDRESDIDDYITVRPSRIVSSIFEHISLGLSDLDGAGSLRLEEIYREYSSQLRVKVRDKPTRSLLDDLDLLEEELESILSVIQKQKTALERFMTFMEDTISKSKRGSRDVLQNSIRELNDKADLYSEMNSSIEKLRRRVVRQVDLQQDNNSKTILVFTIVTVLSS